MISEKRLSQRAGRGALARPAERRAKTLRRVTDLFVFGSSHFSDDHVAVFDGVFQHLMADIETSARAVLADRLRRFPTRRRSVIRTLAFDDAIEVAGPILAESEQLDNVTSGRERQNQEPAAPAGDLAAQVARRDRHRRAGRARRPRCGAERRAECRRQIFGNRLCPAGQALRGRRRAGAIGRFAAGNFPPALPEAADHGLEGRPSRA